MEVGGRWEGLECWAGWEEKTENCTWTTIKKKLKFSLGGGHQCTRIENAIEFNWFIPVSLIDSFQDTVIYYTININLASTQNVLSNSSQSISGSSGLTKYYLKPHN